MVVTVIIIIIMIIIIMIIIIMMATMLTVIMVIIMIDSMIETTLILINNNNMEILMIIKIIMIKVIFKIKLRWLRLFKPERYTSGSCNGGQSICIVSQFLAQILLTTCKTDLLIIRKLTEELPDVLANGLSFKKLPEMLASNDEYPAGHRKAKFWRFLPKHCKSQL